MVYEWLARLGIRFATLEIYVREFDNSTIHHRSTPTGVTITVTRVDEVHLSDRPQALREEDIVVRASSGDSVVGRVFVSYERSVFVPPVEASVDFGGAYLWRLAVSRTHRQQGIATALIDRAVNVVDKMEANAAYALIAVDNVPSKRTFATIGFEPRGTITYGRALRWKRRRVHVDPQLAPIRICR
jgi:GNAT superfamily N-acetyltransferase